MGSRSVPVGGFVSNDISATPRLIALKDSPQGIARRIFERASVELSDGRELALDLMGSVGAGTLPVIAGNIKLNAPAPAFSGLDGNGHQVSLQALRGQNVLLTFFPHCFTGGCESHLSSLRDAYAALQNSGTQVVAVSTDDAPTVAAFAKQLKLPFPVLSDSQRKIAKDRAGVGRGAKRERGAVAPFVSGG